MPVVFAIQYTDEKCEFALVKAKSRFQKHNRKWMYAVSLMYGFVIQMIRKQFFLAETLFNNILQKGSVFLC